MTKDEALKLALDAWERGDGKELGEILQIAVQSTEQTSQEEFQRFVKDELGDIAVLDEGKFVSDKIKTYWRVWCAARGVRA